MELKIIARAYSDFPTKFGVPRQSGIAENLLTEIVMEKEYRDASAFRGLEEFSHLWLLWQFSENLRDGWSPTVRPPRLGGNRRMGVFATRSPFRPNEIGLSSVKLERIEYTRDRGTVLIVSGADLINGTPIFDIKPYLAFTDSHPDAICGFAEETAEISAKVIIPENLEKKLPRDKADALRTVLENDPRPSYIEDTERVYGFPFSGYEIKFKAENGTITVTDITEKEDEEKC